LTFYSFLSTWINKDGQPQSDPIEDTSIPLSPPAIMHIVARITPTL
jgi:hypothetical protein